MDREGIAVTIPEIEAHLSKHYPDHKWVVPYDNLIGLPMIDGVMFYSRIHPTLDEAAKYVITMSQGKHTA